VGPAQLLLVQDPTDRIEPRPAHFRGHVGSKQARIDGLGPQLPPAPFIELAGGLDLLLVGIQLALDELASRFYDQLLLFGQREVHEDTFLAGTATVSAAHVCSSCSCRRNCSVCLAAGPSL